jgi:hypothetical protein
MNVVKVTVKTTSNDSWTAYFDGLPTLEAIVDTAHIALRTRRARCILEVLEAATPTLASSASANNKPTSLCNLVIAGGTQIGVIEYAQIPVTQLAATEKVLPTSERPQIAGTR